ncbi:ABC transporter substrate-binding protein [Fluviispira multicolorata]|uniref:ABC transporter substrate-binding protein n=1 Tax=Fluviispira multicolorata TaxID=2654512 RepID=A0A833JG23_9BACT|nr:ABC transporter substrate-binding protein [Fluviispira multicolorata]KAB8031962.1 ABC transporter substrate-binding protein [Fluviispira multicolorata]
MRNQIKKEFRTIPYFILLVILAVMIFYVLGKKNHGTINSKENNDYFPLVLGTDWFAQAEHGGFYQAVAEGIYEKYGLNVKIKMGGPQVNGIQLLLADEVQFYVPASYIMMSAAKQKLPIISVAAIFQKDIQVLLAHPNVGNDTLENMKNKPIFISAPTAASIWGFLEGKYGYKESQKKSYSHSLTPFLQDKNSIQEGILTSEPYLIEKNFGFKPVAILLSDYGFSGYGELLTTTKKFEEKHPKIVQNFVNATLEGWKSYLENPTLGNELIKNANPEMTDELLQFAHQKFINEKIISGGDAELYGMGIMTDVRWREFANMLIESKAFDKNIDYHSIYTLKYLNNTK